MYTCLHTTWRAKYGSRVNRKGLVIRGNALIDRVIHEVSRIAEDHIPNYHSIVVDKDDDVEDAIVAWARAHARDSSHCDPLGVVNDMALQKRALGIYVLGADERYCKRREKEWRSLWTLADCSLPVCLFLTGASRHMSWMNNGNNRIFMRNTHGVHLPALHLDEAVVMDT